MSVPPPPPAVAQAYESAPSPHRETMLAMRERVLSAFPDASEKMSYSMPAFVIDGVTVCGFAAQKNHVGYYPFSGSTLAGFPELVSRYGGTKSALHVPVDAALPVAEIVELVNARLAEGR
jgi:uncharacterized protein YdhG (YjbR/CyaY superfamily)